MGRDFYTAKIRCTLSDGNLDRVAHLCQAVAYCLLHDARHEDLGERVFRRVAAREGGQLGELIQWLLMSTCNHAKFEITPCGFVCPLVETRC